MLTLGRMGAGFGRMGAPGGAAPTLTFVASAVSASGATVTIPASAAVGDLAVLLDHARNTSSTIPTKVIPANWTEAADVSGSGVTTTRGRVNIAYKILGAGEPGSNITGMDDTTEGKIVLVFRPSRPISSIVASTATGEVTPDNPASQSIAMAGVAGPVVGIAHWYGGTAAVDPRTATPAMQEVANGTTQYAGYAIYNGTGVSHSIDMDDEGTMNILQGVYLRAVFA